MRFSRRVPNQEYYDTQYDEQMYALHGLRWDLEKDAREIARLRYRIMWLSMALVLAASLALGLGAYIIGRH